MDEENERQRTWMNELPGADEEDVRQGTQDR
jgi:hypothetical protein